MRPSTRVLIARIACAITATFTLSLTVSSGVAAVEAIPDGVKYRGTGELLLPAASPSKMRQEAFGCSGCAWRFTEPCASELGAADQQCEVRDSTCDQGQLLRIWVLKPERSWQEFGVSCFAAQGPLFIREIRHLLKKQLVNALPALRIDCTPQSAVVKHLPFRCSSSSGVKTIVVLSEIEGNGVRLFMKPHGIWRHVHMSGTRQILAGAPESAPTWSSIFSHGGAHQISQQVTWQPKVHLEGLSGSMWMPRMIQRAHRWISVGTLTPVLPPQGR
jgi:hypothetical protein